MTDNPAVPSTTAPSSAPDKSNATPPFCRVKPGNSHFDTICRIQTGTASLRLAIPRRRPCPSCESCPNALAEPRSKWSIPAIRRSTRLFQAILTQFNGIQRHLTIFSHYECNSHPIQNPRALENHSSARSLPPASTALVRLPPPDRPDLGHRLRPSRRRDFHPLPDSDHHPCISPQAVETVAAFVRRLSISSRGGKPLQQGATWFVSSGFECETRNARRKHVRQTPSRSAAPKTEYWTGVLRF